MSRDLQKPIIVLYFKFVYDISSRWQHCKIFVITMNMLPDTGNRTNMNGDNSKDSKLCVQRYMNIYYRVAHWPQNYIVILWWTNRRCSLDQIQALICSRRRETHTNAKSFFLPNVNLLVWLHKWKCLVWNAVEYRQAPEKTS